jgi:hypothetical protein
VLPAADILATFSMMALRYYINGVALVFYLAA